MNSTRWRWLLIIILVFGIFFRLVNLERKVIWIDESATVLRMAGYTKQEFRESIFNGQIIRVSEIQTDGERRKQREILDTVEALLEAPEHPPLYYLTLRFWVGLFGNSIATMRSFGAIISLLIFPCIYWLCWELFNRHDVGWVAVALVAVSPFHIVYAQEARQYGLWTITILLANAALLRAIRLQNISNWFLYTIALSLAFYTHTVSALVALSHGIYILGRQGVGSIKTLLAYILASVGAVVLFLPWIVVIFVHSQTIDNVTGLFDSITLPPFLIIGSVLINFVILFLDLPSALLWQLPPENYQFFDLILIIISLLILGLLAYTIYYLCRHTSRKVWLFLLTGIFITPIALTIPDLLYGGIRSIFSRYHIPAYLAIQITVAYFFTSKIFESHFKSKTNDLWRKVFAVLITFGVISGLFITQSSVWWNKYFNNENIAIAKVINNVENPLVISDFGSNAKWQASSHYNIISLAYHLKPNVRLQLFKNSAIETNFSSVPSNFKNVFLLNPSEQLINKIKSDTNLSVNNIYEGQVYGDLNFTIFQLGERS